MPKAHPPINTLGGVYDELCDVRDLIQCVWMAAGLVEPCEPLQLVLDYALDRLTRARDAVQNLKGQTVKAEADAD